MITISRTMPKARYCCRGLLFVANTLNEITLQRYYKKYFARSIIIELSAATKDRFGTSER